MTAAERKRLYRRRRIVFFSALAVVLALAVFTVYSLVRGAVSVHGMAGASAAPALSRAEVPAAPQRRARPVMWMCSSCRMPRPSAWVARSTSPNGSRMWAKAPKDAA